MKAKLIKENNQYNLYVDNEIIASTYPYQNHKLLSKQNCDEIFGVVDVEKLFNEVDETIDFNEFCFTSFKLGFNKAMELNKDKVFTLEDIKKAIQFGWDDEGMMAKEISDKYGFDASEYHSENIIPPTAN